MPKPIISSLDKVSYVKANKLRSFKDVWSDRSGNGLGDLLDWSDESKTRGHIARGELEHLTFADPEYNNLHMYKYGANLSGITQYDNSNIDYGFKFKDALEFRSFLQNEYAVNLAKTKRAISKDKIYLSPDDISKLRSTNKSVLDIIGKNSQQLPNKSYKTTKKALDRQGYKGAIEEGVTNKSGFQDFVAPVVQRLVWGRRIKSLSTGETSDVGLIGRHLVLEGMTAEPAHIIAGTPNQNNRDKLIEDTTTNEKRKKIISGNISKAEHLSREKNILNEQFGGSLKDISTDEEKGAIIGQLLSQGRANSQLGGISKSGVSHLFGLIPTRAGFSRPAGNMKEIIDAFDSGQYKGTEYDDPMYSRTGFEVSFPDNPYKWDSQGLQWVHRVDGSRASDVYDTIYDNVKNGTYRLLAKNFEVKVDEYKTHNITLRKYF